MAGRHRTRTAQGGTWQRANVTTDCDVQDGPTTHGKATDSMGCDGPGIFNNDTCGDFLGEICEQLLDVMRHDLENPEVYCLERREPAAISVLVGIIQHIPIASCYIDISEISDCRDRYLSWFDDNMHETGGEPEFLRFIRQVRT